MLLSLKSSANAAPDPYTTVSAEPSSAMRLNPRSRVVSKQSNADEDHNGDDGEPSSRSPKRDEVMWEVGSDSDGDDGVGHAEKGAGQEEEGQRRGLGETSGNGRGERRGLLDDDDAERGEADGITDADVDLKKTGNEEDEAFGDYQAVGQRKSEDQTDRDR